MDTARGNPTILVKYCILCRLPVRTKMLWLSDLISLSAAVFESSVDGTIPVIVEHRPVWRRLGLGFASVLAGIDCDAPLRSSTDSQWPVTPSALSMAGFLALGSSLLAATLSVRMLISCSLMPSFCVRAVI